MTLNQAPLTVPPAILSLKDVTASEKMLLALYAAEPEAINFRARRVVGVGLSGLKKIKGRLIAKGLLRVTGSGYEVLVPGLLPEPERGAGGGHLVPDLSGVENSDKVAPLRKIETPEQILRDYEDNLRLFKKQCDSGEGGFSCELVWFVRKALEATNDLPEGPEKYVLLEMFAREYDRYFDLNFGLENLPRKHHLTIQRLIASATPDQLARLRTRIEQVKLDGQHQGLLLQEYTRAVQATPV